MTGTTWLVWTVLAQFILPDFVQFPLSIAVGVAFVILPILNHLRIVIAICHHNNQIQDTVSGQNLFIILKREKKAAIDMFIVIVVLMFCLAPSVFIIIFRRLFYEQFGVLHVWSMSLTFINSSINPAIYLAKKREIRNAVRSTLMQF